MSGAPAPQSQASMLATITTDLDRIAPRFEIQPSQIHIMRTPTEFYETLKSKILSAQSRVYLSTLYIGKTEHELISTVRTALARNSNLKVSFLVDALRGTRETPNPCSASLLAPLISEFGSSRVEVRLFHTPNLTGLRKKVVPRRINEGWGLQHMKLYGVDDEIIMSGANLSSNYFTDRQDRYHLFSSKELADYFERIYGGICKLSFDVQPSDEPAGYTMSWPTSNPSVSPLDNPKAFRKSATKLLAPLLTPSNSPLSAPSKPSGSSTTIYPIMSFVPLLTPNTSTELPALTTILTHLASPPFHPSTWTFTAGYFNTTAKFRRLLLSTRPAHGTILTAHPHANGFYGSKGVSGMLPDAYTYLARSFLRRIRMEGLEDSIEMREWKRGCIGEPGGWTYHAKGFWVAFPSMEQQQQSLKSGQGHPLDAQNATDPDPSISVIGSSNYTKRAYEMDLEANVLICTSDADLKRRLGEEVKWLKEYANKVDETEFKKPERRVGLGVKFSMWLVRVLGGAL
ncbi:CDP-diacylglycerol-glycerol-3-phosphate 3-phosphatidyltransferas-like protein [Delitschia confertaspora ATCC 74209]|uniref:CDP-diacylglycerol--glycerol-3-phosphate 3-phosphatidyltransferase n=1 Tax=Delitschia confertaspora ATCC 74209 TaxID=1513339 RepID=A0A9P4MZB8_9PLEO|nr:CDP-diacylglycerol-glycerol-3-phosphate 3-phosphatidyltransferas-like protein [Delitschia confertaspora ATCC 74209]